MNRAGAPPGRRSRPAGNGPADFVKADNRATIARRTKLREDLERIARREAARGDFAAANLARWLAEGCDAA